MNVVFDQVRYPGQRIPARFWGDPTQESDDTLAQAMRLTALEFSQQVSFMPDLHLGYGFPIGTVFAAKDVIVPYGVGNDIGCGLIAGRTHRSVSRSTPTQLRRALDELLVTVPSGDSRGQGSHKEEQDYPEWAGVDELTERAALAASHAGARIELDMARSLEFVRRAVVSARRQIGTLGSGNHFLEFQADEDEHIWVMIHSGSRGLGGAICTFYDQLAALLTEQWYASAGRKKSDIAFLPVDSFEGQAYIAAMNVCLAFAQENRRRMLDAGLAALDAPLVGEAINVHHNLASLENHFRRNVWVHRKGATRARAGELVAIPGSMETGSYICEGLGEPQSLMSSSHGAGRKMSRTAARELRTYRQVQDDMNSAGILIASPNLGNINDEGGHGYKAIEDVMRQQTDLLKPLHRLRPLGVLKG